MFIQKFEGLCRVGQSMQVKLPRSNLKLDKRANSPRYCRFYCDYHDDGITVTLTRLKNFIDHGYHKEGSHGLLRELDCVYFDQGQEFEMRVFDPSNETVPDFDSKIYLYMGVDGEMAPFDTISAIIEPSVKTIKRGAFSRCTKMKKCILHNKVEAIEQDAFLYCLSMKVLFLPSSLEIEPWVFHGCWNIRIMQRPRNVDFQQVGSEVIANYRTSFRTTRRQEYAYDGVHQAIIDFNRNLTPLHQTCLDINVSAEAICNCIRTHGTAAAYNTDYDGMTPMHILALNPHARVGSILACFDANKSAVFARYRESRYDRHDTLGGMTPLECLLEYDVNNHTLIVTALCMHRFAIMGEQDNQNMNREG